MLSNLFYCIVNVKFVFDKILINDNIKPYLYRMAPHHHSPRCLATPQSGLSVRILTNGERAHMLLGVIRDALAKVTGSGTLPLFPRVPPCAADEVSTALGAF